jgi:hypothetical protein
LAVPVISRVRTFTGIIFHPLKREELIDDKSDLKQKTYENRV